MFVVVFSNHRFITNPAHNLLVCGTFGTREAAEKYLGDPRTVPAMADYRKQEIVEVFAPR